MNNIHVKRVGFTIVELLIVIVVIGILAAITIVSYSNVQGRAKNAELVSDLNKLGKQISLFNAENGRYPTGNAEYKQILTEAGYWEITRTTTPNFKRFIYCRNATGVAIVRMSAYGGGVQWYAGAERPTWSSIDGMFTPLATSSSVVIADVCADIGISSPTYNAWAHGVS